MGWGYFAGFAGFVLAIGAALDFVIKPAKKRALATWLQRKTGVNSTFGYNGSKFLDRIFGGGLLSRRALIRYSIVSLASIAISYAFAVFTSPLEEVAALIRVFPLGVTTLGIIILVLCIAFAVVGDFASYAITRLFIRTVDQYRTPVVSLGLVVADIIVSLSLFFFAFSIARAISYLLVFSFASVPFIESTEEYMPEVVQSQLATYGVREFDQSRASATTLAALVASAKREPELSQTATVLQKREFRDYKTTRYLYYVATVSCFDKKKNELFGVLGNTVELLDEVATELNASRISKLNSEELKEQVVEKGFALALAPGECPARVLKITRRMTAPSLLAAAGPGNTYLAALERTMFDAYSVIAFKLSPYVSFDPYQGTTEFIMSLQAMMTTSLLGMSPLDDGMIALVEAFPSPPTSKQVLNVPFSPMVASSLTSSLFFLFYLTLIGVTLVRNRMTASVHAALPNFDLNKGLFTSFGLAALLIVLAAMTVQFIAVTIWGFVF